MFLQDLERTDAHSLRAAITGHYHRKIALVVMRMVSPARDCRWFVVAMILCAMISYMLFFADRPFLTVPQ